MLPIWKFDITTEERLQLPVGASLLSVAEQHGRLVLWALVTPTNALETRRVSVYGTGHPMPDNPGLFIGSAVMMQGELVLHVFEPF